MVGACRPSFHEQYLVGGAVPRHDQTGRAATAAEVDDLAARLREANSDVCAGRDVAGRDSAGRDSAGRDVEVCSSAVTTASACDTTSAIGRRPSIPSRWDSANASDSGSGTAINE